MFTGIVEGKARVERWDAPRLILGFGMPFYPALSLGESIAINGVCLTAVENSNQEVLFHVGPETLACVPDGMFEVGAWINWERSLLPTTRISGHFVLGHVDGVVEVASVLDFESGFRRLDGL